MKNIGNPIESMMSLPTPFPVGDVNVFLIKGEKDLTLIDAGPKTEAAKESLIKQINKQGYSIKDISQVILTHHHSDHSGWIDLFDEDVPIYGHKDTQRWLVRDQEFLALQQAFFTDMAKKLGLPEDWMKHTRKINSAFALNGTRPLTSFIKEGDRLPGHPDWEVRETFGHAGGHLSFYHPESNTLIGGDLLLEKISPNPILEPPFSLGEERQKPQLQLNESLRKIAQEHISLVLPGHGNAITEPYPLIDTRLRMQHERAMYVTELIGKEKKSVLEICILLFPKAFKREPALTLSETLAQLDYLEDLGKVTTTIKDGVLYYSVLAETV